MASQLKLSPSLAIPASASTLYPFSLRLTDRRDEPMLTPGRAAYFRLVDEDGAVVGSVLGDTSGTALDASASDNFPSGDGWRVLTTSTTGLFEGTISVASGATAGAYELQAGWLQFGAVRQDRAGTAFAGSGLVDLSPVTDVLGTPAGASLAADVGSVLTRIGVPNNDTIAADVATLTSAGGAIGTTLGTPTSDVSADIGAVLYQTQVTNNAVPAIQNAAYLCTGQLALGGHTTTTVKSISFPESGIDYTGMRLLIRRTSDGNAEVRTISSVSFTPPRSMTVSAAYQFTPQDGDYFAVLAP